jgi:haloalkane dehalogenase
MEWDDLPSDVRPAIWMMRQGPTNYLMGGVANIFLTQMLPDLTHRTISEEALAFYRAPYPDVASRKAVRQWPREIPLGGEPADNAATIGAYHAWLKKTPLPKLLFFASPGTAIKEEDVAWAKKNLKNLQTVDIGKGIHFFPESHPHKIGSGLSKWYATLSPTPAPEPKPEPAPAPEAKPEQEPASGAEAKTVQEPAE